MNQQFKVTGRWFSQYPLFSSKTIATWKIFFVSLILGTVALNIGVHWGNPYPSASQRGQKPQAARYRPLIVSPYEFESGAGRTKQDADLYAKGFIDDYAFKRTLFRSRSAF